LAGLGCGFWTSQEEVASLWQLERRFEPGPNVAAAAARRARWTQALDRSRDWAREGS
jgi:glycerol kinase